MAKESKPAKFQTSSGLDLKEVYKPSDCTPNQELPGEFPFTRGIHRSMYRGRVWTMRQYAGFGSAAETNKRFHYLLKQGTTGLSVAFDLPTQMGRDSDHPMARGEVGRVGVAISTLEDMQTLLEGVPLDQVSISMTINATAPILLGFLLVLAERQKVPWSSLNGTVQNDILKEYIARGTYIYPPQHGLRVAADLCEFCAQAVSNWNSISISGYHIREAGCTAVQEVAFTLADGINYVDALVKRGLKVDDFAARFAFFFNCHNNFLEEVAKFRAARRLWAKIMKERFGAKSERAAMLRFHTQTAGSSLTAQQPLNNVVRTTLQALAAVLGGTQSLHTNSYDEALGLPTEQSALLALRTQQVIAHESGVVGTADPLGGSYAIESMTEFIERESLALIKKIDDQGGMLRAIEDGFPQGEIERSAYAYQQNIEAGEQKIVGVNCHEEENQSASQVFKVDPALESNQIKRILAYRKNRSGEECKKALNALEGECRAGRNVMPSLVECIRMQATLGEISDRLRAVFGEYRPG